MKRLWVAVLLLVPTVGRAEVSVHPNVSTTPATLMMTISEAPDPVDSKIWRRYDLNANGFALNTAGESRGDGPPSVAWQHSTAHPVVTWAWFAGLDHDIAFSQWTGQAWSTVEFLTNASGDERDPRVFVEPDGTIHVTWWVADAKPRVYTSSRSNASVGWSVPLRITGANESGRRPSVIVVDGTPWIAYERVLDGGLGQEIVAVPLDGQTLLPGVVVDSVARTDRLDVMIHGEAGHLWAEWKLDDTEFAWSESGLTGWTPAQRQSWTDPTWVGAETVRCTIRDRVLTEGPGASN